jgi:hypothetical protein
MPALVYNLLAIAYAVPALMEQWNERMPYQRLVRSSERPWTKASNVSGRVSPAAHP